jgi:hypothetical protein
MTTPAEKVALDVIRVALTSATAGDKKPIIAQLAMLTGLTVWICQDHGISKNILDQLVDHRWNDYRETFGDARNHH